MQLHAVKPGSPQHAVLRRLAAVPLSLRKSTRILDVPAGVGAVAFPLASAGFDVTALDLFPEEALAILSGPGRNRGDLARLCRDALPSGLSVALLGRGGLPDGGAVVVTRGDMEKPLPFADAFFDVVASVEGVEHIGAQEQFVREVRRILSRGGRLLLTTPNRLCLRSRLAYALTGQRTLRTFIDEHTTVQARDEERIYHGHAFLSDYFELRYLLHNNGFRIDRVLPSGLSRTSLLLAPLMAPPVALFTLLAAARWKKRFRRRVAEGRIPAGARPPYREITRHVLSRAALLDGSLVVDAEAV